MAFKLGQCYTKLNRAPQAAAAYQNALRYEYPDSSAYLYLGKALQADGKYGPAIDAYTNYLEYQPDDLPYKGGLKRVLEWLLPQSRSLKQDMW